MTGVALTPVDKLFPKIKRSSDGWLDLCACDLRNRSFAGVSLVKVRFGDDARPLKAAQLNGVSFRGSRFEWVDFPHAKLEGNDFRFSTFDCCDFRFVVFARTTLADCQISDCDFYRAYFEASTVLEKVRLSLISLDKAWLAGIVGLERSTFENPSGAPALVQEADDETYSRFLERTKDQRGVKWASGETAQNSISDAIARKRIVAAGVYRRLSGLWTASGQFDAATFAYVHSQELERKHHGLRVVKRMRRNLVSGDLSGSSRLSDLGRFIWLSIARWSCNYGEDLRRIVVAIAFLIVFPGTLYALTGSVQDGDGHTVGSWSTCVLFSLEQITTLSSKTLVPANRIVELGGSLETLFGISLLGLFGFVLGNKIRNG